MGGNRKNKAKGSLSSSSHHHHDGEHELVAESYQSNSNNASDYEEYDEEEEEMNNTAQSLDFSKVLQDVEGSLVGTMTTSFMAITQLLSSSPAPSNRSFRVTWKELLYLLLAIVMLAGLSIFMGVAAGITISIHYFDTHTTPSFPRLEARERDLGPHQRVTTLDYSIVSSNVLQHPSVGTPTSSSSGGENALTLGRVITMSQSGQRSVLLVVEETEALHTVDNNETRAHSSAGGTTNKKGGGDSNVDEIEKLAMFGGHYKPYRHEGPPDSRFQLSASTVHPTFCSDGITIGYNDWYTLKAAIEEANTLSAERFMKWNEYFASLDGTGNSATASPPHENLPDDPHLGSRSPYGEDYLRHYYDESPVFTICPGSTLTAKAGPIFINAENIVIECGDPEEYYFMQAGRTASCQSAKSPPPSSREMPTCTLDVGGTHLAFGPHARNVLVRGLVFQSAKSSSLAFHYDGAQASFEDCVWMDNSGANGKYGAVADVNSTSSLNFYRCEIGPSLASVANIGSPGGGGGHGAHNGIPAGAAHGGGMAPGIASFLPS